VRAERDGTIAEVVAKPGLAVDAKDLLVVFA
jgi:biotin carboxyl carrier protein